MQQRNAQIQRKMYLSKNNFAKYDFLSQRTENSTFTRLETSLAK